MGRWNGCSASLLLDIALAGVGLEGFEDTQGCCHAMLDKEGYEQRLFCLYTMHAAYLSW